MIQANRCDTIELSGFMKDGGPNDTFLNVHSVVSRQQSPALVQRVFQMLDW